LGRQARRQRQHQTEGAMGVARRGLGRPLDAEVTAFGTHDGTHGIHAHAASGHLGDGRGRGEAGVEDQLCQFVVVRAGVGCQQALVDGFLADARQRQAAAVVA
jgi:hypothetical protein